MRERKDSSVMRVAAVVTTAVTMLPRVAEANAGTPLIWGVMTHLLLGNFLIGIAEGILAWRFLPSRKPGVCIGLMVAANYFSTWLAHLSVNCWMGLFEWADVRYVGASFWCAVVVAWLFTIVAEFPFVWFVFRGEKGRFMRTVKASFAIQSASYVVLFALYAACSETSLMSVDVMDIADVQTPEDVAISFVGKDGKGYVGDLSIRDWKETNAESIVSVATNRCRGQSFPWVTNIGKYDGDWNVHGEFWGGSGLHFRNRKNGDVFSVGMGTPIDIWRIGPSYLLSDGKVVFQLGRAQICVADPERKCIAVVANGDCLVARQKDER